MPHILVVGGSQGSKRITEVCISVFKMLEEEPLPFQATLQTGERNLAWAQTLQPPENTHLVPFIESMADAYARADLVVCRAGSGTLSELTLWEKPAVLIPYPHASANHQKVNADTFARHHAAVTIEEADLNEETLRRELRRLLRNKETRDAMSRRMAELYKPHAAERIAEEIVRLLQE
ncbi:hypothetical protein GF373_00065 [bacterium]|nr:hypothetical protein [bacterium]